MNFEDVIQRIIALRDKASELNQELDQLKQQRALLEEDLMQSMASSGMTQAGSSAGTATLKLTKKATVVNWNEFENYVKQTDNFQLFQRRISPKAYDELSSTGEVVPGVDVIEQYDVSIRRKTSKGASKTSNIELEE